MEEVEKFFQEYREYLKAEIVRLVRYIRLYRRLNERMGDRLDEMNIAPNFFATTLDALFSVIVLWVDKLFSPKSQRGFWNFLSFIENNRKMLDISELQRRGDFPNGHWMLDREPITFETIRKDREKIENIDSLPHFERRRQKFHAHFDKEYFFDRKKLKNDAPLKWPDLNRIIDVMDDILNKYSASYDGNTYHLNPLNIHDVDHVLDILHEYEVSKAS